ncbi:DUF4276 family protein [Nitrospiraceae bacterium AH_259_D15_M11_P09]|nr:DUF4276 family protein [Nitrospiraceae bacterium AH_259_D15_M11_P09]
MKKIFIYAEGPTEERFIKTLLVPHLEGYGIFVYPIVCTTKVVKSGQNFKGGTVKYHKAKKEICNLLRDSSAAAVTTMLDYYGLHCSFPGRTDPEGTTCYDRVRFVEGAIRGDIGPQKFIPFLTLHEFEGLLFSSPEEMAAALPGGYGLRQKFEQIRGNFNTPEDINDQQSTSPGQRIATAYPPYQKPAHGSRIAGRIGLAKIREECPHFDSWVVTLEQLSRE